jgi:hypothetical protein
MTVETFPSAVPHDDTAALTYPTSATDPANGMIAGMVGGFVGSLLMMHFQDRWGARLDAGNGAFESTDGTGHGGETEQQRLEHLAAGLASRVLGREQPPHAHAAAARVTRVAFGTLAGGLYGIAAEESPELTRGGGMPFGHAVWTFADEAAGGRPPEVEPYEQHLGGHHPPHEFKTRVSTMIARFVYGFTTESVRRAVRARLGSP